MPDLQRQMNLCYFFSPWGYHRGAWRNAGSRSDDLLTLNFIRDAVMKAEQASLDAVFLADVLNLGDNAKHPTANKFEPLAVLGALAALTSRIGLVATVSTTYSHPFNLARSLATIDHLSNGRTGWNIVTSFLGSENFGNFLPDHRERYARAEEFVEVITSLWDSWQDDAIVNDRESGYWTRPDRIHAVNFKGRYYQVAGPLNVARPPQGWPVLVQAGSSEAGMAFAARHAEVIFTAQSDLAVARKFYLDLKSRARAMGRDPDQIRVLPGIMPIIGDTTAAARELAEDLADLVDHDIALATEPL